MNSIHDIIHNILYHSSVSSCFFIEFPRATKCFQNIAHDCENFLYGSINFLSKRNLT